MDHQHLYSTAPTFDREMDAIVSNSDNERDVMAWELEYRYRVFNVFCDLCQEQDSGTAMQLENRGWKLTRIEQFCGCHRGI